VSFGRTQTSPSRVVPFINISYWWSRVMLSFEIL